jgi:hypothetical protein
VANAVSISQPKPEIVLDPASGFSVHLLRDIPNGEQLYSLLLELVGKHRVQQVEAIVDSPAYEKMVEDGLIGADSWASIYLDRALTKGLAEGREEFMMRLQDPDFPWDDYGVVDPRAREVLSGERLMDLRELLEDDALNPDEKKELLEGGFRGVPSRQAIEVPRG